MGVCRPDELSMTVCDCIRERSAHHLFSSSAQIRVIRVIRGKRLLMTPAPTPTLDAAEARPRPEDLASADAVFPCNAVRGILPVARLGGRTCPPHPGTVQARRLLAAAHPVFAPEPS
jgi:hypothetical protein